MKILFLSSTQKISKTKMPCWTNIFFTARTVAGSWNNFFPIVYHKFSVGSVSAERRSFPIIYGLMSKHVKYEISRIIHI